MPGREAIDGFQSRVVIELGLRTPLTREAYHEGLLRPQMGEGYFDGTSK
jgi:hypothetical protein